MMQRLHRGKLDPFRMNMMPVVFQISQFFGELANDSIRANRDATNARLKATQFQIMLLESEKSGADEDELRAIEKQIKYWRNRLVVLEEELEELNDV